MKAERVAYLGVLISFSLVLSYVESQLPFFPMLPGIRIGLANTVILFSLYKTGFKDAVIITIFKCFLSAFLFGSLLSFLYSFTSSLFSLLIMFVAKKTNLLNIIAISVLGAISHNVMQVMVAILLLQNLAIRYYIPVLVLTGAVSGLLTGLITNSIIKRVYYDFY